MGLYIKATTGQSKHEFVSSVGVGADLLTEVAADEVAIFVGPDTLQNIQEIVSGIRQCRYALREQSVPAPDSGATRSAAFVEPGAGQAAVTVDTGATTLDDAVVAVAYGEDWPEDREAASIFLTNQVQQLVEVWLETVGKLS